MSQGSPVVYPRDIKHVIIEISTRKLVPLEDLLKFTKFLADLLKSQILSVNYVEFEEYAYTVLAVLSTSHVAISTYIVDGGLFIDVDLAWCSSVNLDEEEVRKKANEMFDYEEISIINVERELAKKY